MAVIFFEVVCICEVVIIFLGLAIRQDDLPYLLGHAYLSCLSPIQLGAISGSGGFDGGGSILINIAK